MQQARSLGAQIKTKQRVRDLAEVYTHEREVNAMLDLVADMFPSEERPRDIGRTFLEPSCGAGNFLVAILDRKLAYVGFGALYRSVATFETAVLKALSSIYGIDIDSENVEQSRAFLRADVAQHMNLHLNTVPVSEGFWPAVEAVLATNIIRADTIKDAQRILLVEYRWQRRTGEVIRAWSHLKEPDGQLDLFGQTGDGPLGDEVPIHYGLLGDHPEPVRRQKSTSRRAGRTEGSQA
ncbi:type III restriction endonuclease subunit M [Nocardioides mangrovicus]|uniref:Type III restriction endonuclease subunit M n=1 Tax=Nocardioides mangrovicus TaxID=2478913 RepID=A0A3L8P198_9ACTN|nr:type III restriction endonuclease subunit M [Nocardioides mangrovicus]